MLAAVLIAAIALPQHALPEIKLYVAPNGSDESKGRSPDEPLATPFGASRQVTVIRAREDIGCSPVTVLFASGTYELAEPLVIGITNGGTVECPTVYAAAPGAAVIFSGGARVGPWREAEMNGREVYAADLPAPLRDLAAREGGTPFRTLWINGQRRPWARHPGGGSFFHVHSFPPGQPGAPPPPGVETPPPQPGDWVKGQTAFIYDEADAPVWAKIAPGAEVVTFTRWVDTHLRVVSVEPETHTVRFASPNVFGLAPGDLYYVEGDPSLLDSPGEWWCDAKAGVVYAMPLPGERFAEGWTEAIVPRLDTLVSIAGDDRAALHDITFRGITFAYARWWFPEAFKGSWPSATVIGFPQAAVGVPGAVRVESAHRITFEDCTFEHVEGYGLELGRGCTDCRVSRCTVRDLGAGGIKIGETAIRENESERTHSNTVEDCTITDGGHIHHQAVGLWIGQSGANTIAHNLISEFDYTGISIGWTWGYGPALAAGNIVEFNEVRSLGSRPGNAEPPLGDMGGIYTLGVQGPTADEASAPALNDPPRPRADPARLRTIIRNNYFHDIAGRTIAWGIYFDEGSTGIVAENNLVLRTTHGGFHQHYGRDNILRNNVFALGRDAQLWRTRREEHNSFTFTGNIVIGDSDTWLAGDWSDHLVSEKNLYWRPGGKPIAFPGSLDFSAWQAAGHDTGSIVADPMFEDASNGNCRLKEGSPASSVGFVPFDVGQVGPRAKSAK